MTATKVTDYLKQFEAYSPKAPTTSGISSAARGNNFDNGHIFYAILEYAIKFSPEREKYTYYYSISQKLLVASRSNDRNVASYFIDKLVENGVSKVHFDNDVSYHALHSIFNPPIAYYYYYLHHDYANAEIYMLELLKNIDFLINHGFKDGIYMKIEQYLNISRVYFNAGSFDKAAKYAREVMRYLLSSGKETFEFPFSEVLNSQNQLNSILALFFNGIIFKALSKADEGDFYQNRFLLSVFSNLDLSYNSLMDEELKKTIEAFLLILENKQEDALKIILRTSVFEQHIPTSLRYFILSWLLQYDNLQAFLPEQLQNSILTYQQSELKLSGSQISVFKPQPVAA